MKPHHKLRTLLLVCLTTISIGLQARDEPSVDELFSGPVPRLQIEIPDEGLKVLRSYKQVWRQERPERIDVRVTVRESEKVYTNVALHLKGSFSFQPVDGKPSMTLNFDRFAPGQLFHGLLVVDG